MSHNEHSVHLFLLLGSKHELRADILVKLLRAQSLELHSTLLQGEVFLVGVLGHLGSHVISNDGVQAGHEHQTISRLALTIKWKWGDEVHTFRGEES